MANRHFAYVEGEYSRYLIDKIRVFRQPLKGGDVLKRFSVTKFAEGESPYHAGLELAIRHPETGAKRVLRLEKSYALHADLDRPGGLQGAAGITGLGVDMGAQTGKIALGDFIQRTREAHATRVGMSLEEYDLSLANCQDLARIALEANNIPVSQTTDAFVNQHATERVPVGSVPHRIARAFTDVLAWNDRRKGLKYVAPAPLRSNAVDPYKVYPGAPTAANEAVSRNEVRAAEVGAFPLPSYAPSGVTFAAYR